MINFLNVIWITIVVIAVIVAIPFIRRSNEMSKYYEGPEALAWLKTNQNPYALGSNHFKSTTEAISFVEKLYNAGAESVLISQKTIRVDETTLREEGGPYSDAIVVKLPSDKLKRGNILNICAERADPDYGNNIEREIRNNMLFLWWD